MTEKDIIKLGFKREDVGAEESGANAFYYYTWEPYPLSDFSLISCANDELIDNQWIVNIFNEEKNIIFADKKDVATLIKLIKANTKVTT